MKKENKNAPLSHTQKRTLAILDKYGEFQLNTKFNNFSNAQFFDTIAMVTIKALASKNE